MQKNDKESRSAGNINQKTKGTKKAGGDAEAKRVRKAYRRNK